MPGVAEAERPLTALVLGSPSIVPVAVMTQWLAMGHRIGAFWYGKRHHGQWRVDRVLGRLAPRWSLSSLAARHAFPIREVPPLAPWDEVVAAAQEAGADVLICAYFPYRMPPRLLDLFPGRAFNLHPALLPRYRGPTPLPAMMVDGVFDAAGVTLHHVDAGFDTGAIVAQEPIPFPVRGPPMRHEIRVAQASARLVAVIPDRLAGRIGAVAQDEALALYRRVTKEEFAVLPQNDLAEAKRRLRQMRLIQPVGLPVPGREAIGFRRALGPPSGAPPRIGWRSADFDVADARIRVALRWSGWRRWQRWRGYWLLRRTPLLPRSGAP